MPVKSRTSADGLLDWKPEGRYPALWKLLIEWGAITPDGQRVENNPPTLTIVEGKKVAEKKPYEEMTIEEFHQEFVDAVKSYYGCPVPMSNRAIDGLVEYLEWLWGEYCKLDDYVLKLEGSAPRRSGETRLLQMVSPNGKQYTRKQPLVVREWQCAVCGQHHVQAVLPGQAPKYCPPSNGQPYSPCQKLARTSAVKRHRQGKKSA